MMRLILIALLWGAAYYLPYSAPLFFLEGQLFFATNAFISFIFIFLLLAIQKNKWTYGISALEISAIALNFTALMAYQIQWHSVDFFYQNYEVLLTTINIVEITLLMSWFFSYGISWLFTRGNSKLRAYRHHRHSTRQRYFSLN